MLNLPKLIGHRGVKNLSPENTLNSIKLAKNLGLRWVEIDVKISKDLVPIAIHDDTLERTTNGKGLPINFNYDDIRKLDAGSFFYDYSTNIYIPSLKEVLLLCQQNKIGLNIELKPNLGFEKKNVEAILKVLNELGIDIKYYISSFDLDSLILMSEVLPNAYYGLLINEFDKYINLKNVLDICHKYNFFSCGLNKKIISLEIINKINENNLVANIFSEENVKKNEANELWSMGINSIFIDDPLEFKII